MMPPGIRQAILSYNDILTTAKKLKVSDLGICQDQWDLPRQLYKIQCKEREERGRQKKRWENTILIGHGLRFCAVLRESENKIKWRERVARFIAPRW